MFVVVVMVVVVLVVVVVVVVAVVVVVVAVAGSHGVALADLEFGCLDRASFRLRRTWLCLWSTGIKGVRSQAQLPLGFVDRVSPGNRADLPSSCLGFGYWRCSHVSSWLVLGGNCLEAEHR